MNATAVHPLLILALLAASGAAATRERLLMGTTCSAVVHAADEASAGRLAAAALDEVERWEAVLSTWSPRAELAQLNEEAASRPVTASRELFLALRLALR